MFLAAASGSMAMLIIVKLPPGCYLEFHYCGSGSFPYPLSYNPSSCGFSPCVLVALAGPQPYIPLKAQGRKQSLPGLVMRLLFVPEAPMGTQALSVSAHWEMIAVDFLCQSRKPY